MTNLIPHDVQNPDRIAVIRVIRLTMQKYVFANSRVAIVVPDAHDLGSQVPVVHEANIGGIILASLDQILGFRVSSPSRIMACEDWLSGTNSVISPNR